MTKKKTGGKGNNLASAMSDRTDGRRALPRLHVLSRAVDQSPSLVVITDAAGKIEYVNPRFASVTGYTAEEAIGMHVSDLGDRSPEEQQRIWKILASGAEWRGELRGKGKSGEAYWLSASITPNRSPDGVVTHYLGVGEDITERKRGETALRKSEEQYQDLVENLNDVIYEVDATGRITFVSRAAEGVAGYSRSDIIGRFFTEFFHPDDLQTFVENFQQAISTGVSNPSEYRLKSKRGDTLWFRTNGRPILEGDRVIGFRGVLTDITERKRAEEALRRSEEKYRDLVENLNDVIYEVDATGWITYISPAAEQAGDYALTDLIGRPVTDIVHPDDHASFQESFEGSLQGDAKALEFRLVTKSGEIRWHTSLARPILKDGRVLGLRGVLTDIDESKRAEEALRASEEKYRDLVENLNDVIYEVDADGRITFVSPVVEEFAGYSPPELLGRIFIEFVEPDDRERVLEGLETTLGGHLEPIEFRITTKCGDVHWVRVSSRPIVSEGRTVGLRGVLADITERKRAEEALRASEERFRSTLDNMMEGCTIVGFDWRYLYANDAVAANTSRTKEEILGRTLMEAHEGIERTQEFAQLRRCMEERVPHQMEWEYAYPDGNTAWFDVNVQPVPEGIFVVFLNITERKRAEEALRESEERYRRLVELSPYAIVVHSDGKFVFVNRAGMELFGATSADEIIGRQVWDFVHKDDIEAVTERIQEIQTEGAQVDLVEEKLVRLDGKVIDVEMAAIPITYQGKPARQAVISDISARKRAEEALREREETTLALLNAPTESAYLGDLDGTILAMNEIAARRLGESVDDLVGRCFWDLIPPDVAAFRATKGDEVGRSGKPCRFQDTREGRWYDTAIYPIFDADGKVVRLAIYSSDITEIKEMEEALQKTREELDKKVERQIQRGDPYGLTYRELTVLHLVVAGSSDKEIGTTLGISTPTASKHIANILSKMHASSRTVAGVRALKEGLLD